MKTFVAYADHSGGAATAQLCGGDALHIVLPQRQLYAAGAAAAAPLCRAAGRLWRRRLLGCCAR